MAYRSNNSGGCEFVANGDAAHPFFDPAVGITLILADLSHALHGEFRIFDFLNPLITDFGQPAFERLGLGAGYRLDDPKSIGRVDAVGFATLSVEEVNFSCTQSVDN